MTLQWNNSQLDLLVLADAAEAVEATNNMQRENSGILTPEQVQIPENLMNFDNMSTNTVNTQVNTQNDIGALISSLGELVSKLNSGLSSGKVLDRHDLRYVDTLSVKVKRYKFT